ncbi:hypothetical protein [Paenibacillus sp.]|uniref:hypothetical protein n=1 Tax=Paenibacillus sp. TaxID=58172 RepID=UPI002811E505|nr:hypothetical protein [Paenibacillus sp.]
MNERKKAESPEFAKAELLASKRYTGVDKDVLRAMLPDHELVSHERAARLLQQFKQTEVR